MGFQTKGDGRCWMVMSDGCPSAISRNREHPLQAPASSHGDIFGDRDLEDILFQGPLDLRQIDHLHVRTVKAAANAAIGQDELLLGMELLQAVYERPFRGDDERLRLRVA